MIQCSIVFEYLNIGASTTLECMKKFVLCVIEILEEEYLRKPNQDDIDRLLDVIEAHDFPICWKTSIVCIGSEKIIQRLGKDCLLNDYIGCQLLSLKQSHLMIFGYGMRYLGYQEASMTSMSLIAHPFSKSLMNIGLLNVNMSSMVMSIK